MVCVLWLTLHGLVLAGKAAAGEYVEIWRQAPFSMDVLLQVTPIPGPNGKDDLLILGRNYETREVRLRRFRWQKETFETVWESPNFFEWASHVVIAVGDFRGRGESEVAVVSNSAIRLFIVTERMLQEVWRGTNPLGVTWEAVALRWSDEQPHHLGLTRIAHVLDSHPIKELVWFRWGEPKGEGGRTEEKSRGGGLGWQYMGHGPRVGTVRSLSSFALDERPGESLVVERGGGTDPGTIDVWVVTCNGWERISSQSLRPAAVFALAGSRPGLAPSGSLVIGDNRGRVGLARWAEGRLLSLGEPVPLGWGLADATLADLTGDGEAEIIVLGSPDRLHLLRMKE